MREGSTVRENSPPLYGAGFLLRNASNWSAFAGLNSSNAVIKVFDSSIQGNRRWGKPS